MKLKEIIVLSAVGCSAVCTPPNPEDAKNEAHPVCAVADVHSDTITEGMVEGIRKRCSDVRLEATSKYLRTHPNGVIGSGLDRAGEQGIKDEEKCLVMHGLADDQEVNPVWDGGFSM
ncbi:MAG: hypothetical protein AAB739_01545 [Patescibacteria group bacterium]